MVTQFLGTQESFEIPDFPLGPGCALVIAEISDYREQLFREEQSALRDMSSERQRAFSAGRHSAHTAMRLVGQEPGPVKRRGRAPVWPDGVAGSISHSDRYAAALVSTVHQGCGIDIERAGRVNPRLDRKLFTQKELDTATRTTCQDLRTRLFSAKEAGYKAVFPLATTYIPFQEATILPEPGTEQFRIEYHGPNPSNNLLNEGIGFWRTAADHVITVFLIS